MCPDEEAYQTLGVKDNTKPSLVVSREHGETLRVFDGDLSKSSTSKDLFSWIQSTKSPLLPQLDEKSQKEVFVMGHLVGLLITDPDVKQSHEKVIATMRSAVKAFEPHQPKTKRVNFAWLDGVRWNSYVISAFQLAPKDYPRLLLIDALVFYLFDFLRVIC